MVDVSRVQKELTECNRDREVSGVSIALHDGANISHLTGTIAGPADSPYEGGTFVIDIRLPGEPPVLLQSPPLRACLPSDPPSLSTRRPRPRAIGIADSTLPGRFVGGRIDCRFAATRDCLSCGGGSGSIRVCCLRTLRAPSLARIPG